MKQEQQLIIFTHVDADALGSYLNIEYRFKGIAKKYFFTNYYNIEEKVQEILAHKNSASGYSNSTIIITDVSFSDNIESLRLLNDAFDNRILIDHHMYSGGFFNEFRESGMKVVHDKTKSATLLCNEFFGNTNDNLGKLSKLIDVYDLWQINHPAFDIAQDFNDYFWQWDITKLAETIISRDYMLPEGYAEQVKKNTEKKMMRLTEYEAAGNMIHRSGEVTVAFVDEYFNHILIEEHKSGVNFVIGVTRYGIIRIRVNQNSEYTEEQLNKLRFDLTGNAEYGHLHAFTYKVGEKNINPPFPDLLKEVEKITKCINSL